MLEAYLPVIVFSAIGLVTGITFVMMGYLMAPRRPNRVKVEPYECGLPSEVKAGMRFGISFYLIAMLFILFDVEVIFLYPVAVQLKAFGVFALVEIAIFIALLSVAFVYAWRRGALDWR